MPDTSISFATSDSGRDAHLHLETHAAGVSWSAVIGGGLVIAALWLILLALGAGFDLSALSPWSGIGETRALRSVTIAWMIAVQIIAGTMGGYLAGRLRGRWTRVHRDEVFFRDTAHGFLAWALAIIAASAFLASAATHMVGARDMTSTGATGDAIVSPYYADVLLRADRPVPAGVDDTAEHAEVHRILVHLVATGDGSSADASYLAEMTTARTGLTATAAAARVSDVVARATESADAVRKVTARILLWTFVSLLCGALAASFAATIGGGQRDHVTVI